MTRFALAFCFLLLVVVQAAAPPVRPAPAVRPPAGAGPAVRDVCANFWALAPAAEGKRQLLVLPAQSPAAWIPAQVPGLAPDAWASVAIGEDGFVWLKKGAQAVRFDPRKPEKGVSEGTMAPARIPAQAAWRVVSWMPASNHDLAAAVVGDRFYIAGGLTADWGFPARSHPFDEIWELDPKKNWAWRAAAKLHRARIYCATAAFEKQVWVIGGDVIEPDGTRYAVTTVERYDPRTGAVTRGPEPRLARPMPLALAAAGRLYVMGNAKGEYDKPGKMESLGPGETAWRPEPDGPAGMGPLAGTVLDDRLYVLVPGKGLATYDPATKQWTVLDSPAKPRSCQMAAWRGEIWMMGGRDIDNLAETRIYNPRTRAWRLGPALPIPLSWGAAEVVAGSLVIAGGAAERAPDDKTWIYNDRTFVLTGR